MPGGAHEVMRTWDPEEDEVIMSMVDELGPKWAIIVRHLPGRTVSSVRNRYQRIQKGIKLRESGVHIKNKCHACGEPKRGHICKARSRISGLANVAQMTDEQVEAVRSNPESSLNPLLNIATRKNWNTFTKSNGKAPMQPMQPMQPMSSMCTVGFSLDTNNLCASFTGNQKLLAEDLFQEDYAAKQDLAMWTQRPMPELPELPDPPPTYIRSLAQYHRELAEQAKEQEEGEQPWLTVKDVPMSG